MTHRFTPTRRQLLTGAAAAAVTVPLGASQAVAAPPHRGSFSTAGIDAALSAMVDNGAVGVTTSVVGPTGTYLSAVGERELGKNAAKTQDRARIASVTKGMVAVLVMQRIEAGQWTLDTTIDEVVPGLYPGRGDVTVTQLMNHTSGMPDGLVALLNATPPTELTPEDLHAIVSVNYSKRDLVQLSRALPWGFEPGTNWMYSNAGYVVLSIMLEEATGTSLSRLIRDRIFKPAGMRHSRLEDSTLVRGRYLLPYAGLTSGLEPLPEVDASVFTGAGAVYATAEDVTNFTGALMRGELLSQELVDLMVSPVGAAEIARYGFGLYLTTGPCQQADGSPEVLIGHDGASFGTLTYSFTTRDGSRRVAIAWTGRPLVPTESTADGNAVLIEGFMATCPAGRLIHGLGGAAASPATAGFGDLRL